jgi:predicted nucleic acid-binding protein
VKRYVDEAGSDRVRGWLAADPSATARLSAVEVASALARRCREGAFSSADRDRALAALEGDLETLRVVELSASVTEEARSLLLRHPLRAGDAIQLASALLLRRQLGVRVEFAAFDDRLASAARAEGLDPIP